MKKPAKKKVAKQAENAPLLVELFVEELPPKLIPGLAQKFADGLLANLKKKLFAPSSATATSYASPNRIAATISACKPIIPATEETILGPSVDAPPKTLKGFAAAHGCAVKNLKKASKNGRACFAAIRKTPEQPLSQTLGDSIADVATGIQAPRSMIWSTGELRFVRPVRGLLALHGDQTLADVEAFGIKANKEKKTLGHVVRAPEMNIVPSASKYEATLKKDHKVIVSHEARCELIRKQLDEAAADLGRKYDKTIVAQQDDGLLDENAAMCEHPQVYAASFDSKFLDLPKEVISCCLKNHMRCFSLSNADGLTEPHFLLVADNKPKSPKKITDGFARVVNARLADAKFFWETDKSRSEAFFKKKLGAITYHSKLGSIEDRIDRVKNLANVIYDKFLYHNEFSQNKKSQNDTNQDKKNILRAIEACKLDQATLMIGEYPELEGVISARYFLENDTPETRVAVETHNDISLDKRKQEAVRPGLVLALEIERLVGLIYAGENVSGSKDPYGMRRSVRRLVDICLMWETMMTTWDWREFTKPDNPANLYRLLQDLMVQLLESFDCKEAELKKESYVGNIMGLILARIKSSPVDMLGLVGMPPTNYLNLVIDNALHGADRFSLRLMRGSLNNMIELYDSADWKELTASHKRIANFLKKNPLSDSQEDQSELSVNEHKMLKDNGEDGILGALDYIEKLKSSESLVSYIIVASGTAINLGKAVNQFFEDVHINEGTPALIRARKKMLRLANRMQQSALELERSWDA